MMGYQPWKTCEKCGVTYGFNANHVCDFTAKAKQETDTEFSQVEGARRPIPEPFCPGDGDWRRFDWLPFRDWLRTPQGMFSLWELKP
jgi:hypothetical protein